MTHLKKKEKIPIFKQVHELKPVFALFRAVAEIKSTGLDNKKPSVMKMGKYL
jgi:hypothetical protein